MLCHPRLPFCYQVRNEALKGDKNSYKSLQIQVLMSTLQCPLLAQLLVLLLFFIATFGCFNL